MKLLKKYKQEVLYLVFGVVATVVNWIVYSLLVTLFNCGITISNAIAWLVAVIVAFITNKIYVFESHSRDFKTLIKEIFGFFMSRLSTGVLDVFLPTLLILIGINGSFLSIEGFYAKIIVNVIVIILNYVLSKVFVFKK